jgi:hypothetical protein
MLTAPADRGYQHKIAVAESAVSGMTDPQLKQVAFAKILEQLLSENAPGSGARIGEQHASNTDEVTRRKTTAVRQGPAAYIEELIAEQFFRTPKTLGEVRTELMNRGHHIPRTSLSGPLQALCQRKALRRTKHAANGGKAVFAYSNW